MTNAIDVQCTGVYIFDIRKRKSIEIHHFKQLKSKKLSKSEITKIPKSEGKF